MSDSKVSFTLNKELDKKMALTFIGNSRGGIDFTGGITGPHPDLKGVPELDEDEQKNKISEYFDLFYASHADELESQRALTQNEWDDVDERYFSLVTKIFKNKIPVSEYVGYLSIINCNPRFLDTKSFQVFWKHKEGSVYVASHEILHFFFFDYIKQEYPDTLGKLDPKDPVLWSLSEIFNDVVLDLPEFKALHCISKHFHYPALEKYIPNAKKYWEDSKDVSEWVDRMLEVVQ